MALIISGITLPFTEPEEMAIEKAKQLLGNVMCMDATIVKKSVDARRKDRISFVYSVCVNVDGDEDVLKEKLGNPQINVKKEVSLKIAHGKTSLRTRPIIVGFGPAGMFAGLLLAREGYRPIILERGQSIDIRVKDVHSFWKNGELKSNSNVQFGEGGAGTFSDGKLTTRIGDAYCGFVLEELAKHGAPKEILFNAKPHVGTDYLREVVKNIREEIIRLGGEVRFGEQLDDMEFSTDNSVKSINTKTGSIEAENVILALGHSARDTFSMLDNCGVTIEPKAFSVGVRIEHLQSEIDRMLYGNNAGNPLLPHGEYQLSHREKERAVYTFCMCPGGVVVPAASEDGMVTTNGMSMYARNGKNANSALVVSVDKKDFPDGNLGGMHFQQRLEKLAYEVGGGGYKAPIQTVGEFLQGTHGYSVGSILPTYACGVTAGNFAEILPSSVVEMMKTGFNKFDRRMNGFAAKDVLLTGLETRTSSPVRITRDYTMQSVSNAGLYPCGEGAGYAGGIMSAAVDGLRSAQAIIEKFSASN